ncbi:MAG: 4-alpha-glucanotransferase [Ginsengibacter sp.]
MKISFYLRYYTVVGEELYVTGNNKFLGDNTPENAVQMRWLDNDTWTVTLDLPDDFDDEIHYKYILKDLKGVYVVDGEEDRFINLSFKKKNSYSVFDTWNSAGAIWNVFFTKAFREILLPPVTKIKVSFPKKFTHIFRVKAPLLKPGEILCLCGSTTHLNSWNTDAPIIMEPKNNWFIAKVFLDENEWPASYKYGIYNIEEKKFIGFEQGENRLIRKLEDPQNSITILNDGFVNYQPALWKGTGVSIPVFSLRTKKSFGVGEFNDLKILIDWANQTGIKLIQVLPVNDTIATYTWRDSYPYAAISAFALHPIYINLEKIAGKEFASIIKPLSRKQKQLNELKKFDYEQVLKFKLTALKELFEAKKQEFINDPEYFEFFDLNRHWLVPYAAFSYLRDKYKTPDPSKWKSNKKYNEQAIQKFVAPSQKHYNEILFFYFVQYHLHLQLKEVADYAHKKGIILKGDIPIGVSRHSCDTWIDPALYNMDQQAGAPPDNFAIKGQNWGFPTYNWEKMAEDNFSWWRRRFDNMSNYFDAFRIDHILGFFRIWSIPLESVEGVMGRFVPAIPVDISEFFQRNISFSHDRYCKPFITQSILENIFKTRTEEVKEKYLEQVSGDRYALKEFVNTQSKVLDALKKSDDIELKQGLFDLISNVILFDAECSGEQKFHFRISLEQTSSFHWLDDHTKGALWNLYIDYFFHRQNDYWKKEGMEKLPYLKRNTNMLVCGEDLGMVPPCVPEVMGQLAILGLDIERMPKAPGKEFFHPADAQYLSVVMPSTHDMSTVREWWQENREQTQRFYNYMLGQYGEAPETCETWISKKIVLQHLYSPAMWSIFQLADLTSIDENLRVEDPAEQRINVPSDPNHYWHYRMNLNIEDLIKEKNFSEELKKYITDSGR